MKEIWHQLRAHLAAVFRYEHGATIASIIHLAAVGVLSIPLLEDTVRSAHKIGVLLFW
jgi:hypothetical protein